MPYSPELLERLRDAVDLMPGITEKKMFGGYCFLHQGNMMACVWKEFLVLRLGPEQSPKALKKPNVKPFEITGKPLKGWVMIKESKVDGAVELDAWLKLAREFVVTLPGK